jgi:hypothetical protein
MLAPRNANGDFNRCRRDNSSTYKPAAQVVTVKEEDRGLTQALTVPGAC